MASRKREAPRGWQGARELSPESRAIGLLYPDLHVRLWCNALGLNVVAYVDRSDSKGRLHRTDIASATWRGHPPTEEDVVLWAALVLSRWLEDRLLSAPEI